MQINERQLKEEYQQYRANGTVKVGKIVSFFASIIMIYASYFDRYILGYPNEVVFFRIITIISYLIFFLMCFTKIKNNPKVIIGIYTWCIIVTMILGVCLNVLVFGVNSGIYNTRVIQVIFLFIIGVSIFAEGARGVLPHIMSITIGIMILFFIFYRNLNIQQWGSYFNVIAAAILSVINARIYEKKNFDEFKMRKISSLTLEQLKVEVELRKEAEKKLEKKAYTDEMTGLFNRRAGMKILTNKFELAKKNKEPLSICYIDLNNLKAVNDKYGHNKGDKYILYAVQIIKQEIREEDIFARLGGDEFLLIFIDTNYDETEKIWNSIKMKFHSCTDEDLSCFKVSASHGIETFYDDNFHSVEGFMESADKKMYKEKFNNKIK